MFLEGADHASVTCGACGYEFEDMEQAMACAPDGGRVLPCPACGDSSRNVLVQVSETVTVRDSVSYKAKRPGEKRPIVEGRAGASFFVRDQEWHDVERVIDRGNDRYLEVVRDGVGEEIRRVDEPLSEHRGRGDAKRKSE